MKQMQIKYLLNKSSKNQILMVALQNHGKISFKTVCKSLSYLFYNEFFFKYFSNRPYLKVKILLHH